MGISCYSFAYIFRNIYTADFYFCKSLQTYAKGFGRVYFCIYYTKGCGGKNRYSRFNNACAETWKRFYKGVYFLKCQTKSYVNQKVMSTKNKCRPKTNVNQKNVN